jgi:large subunit ribosomal protein L4
MAEIALKNAAGADAGTVTLDDATFGIQPNVPVMHQVVTAQLAKRRAGTQSTKTRSEVRGGGAKPYRQKGTGNARQGSTNAPHYAGGGVALGPKPRSYAQRTPKKMIKLALRSALSDRAHDGKVVVVDSWGLEAPKTAKAASALRSLGVEGRSLVVIERDDVNAALSFRNLPEVQLIQVGELNAYDVLSNDWIVFTRAALESFATPTATDAGEDIPTEGGDEADVEESPTASPNAASVDAETGEGSAQDEAPASASEPPASSSDEPDPTKSEAQRSDEEDIK